MKNEEIQALLEQIKDMRDQVSYLYNDALSTRDEFDTDSEEWDKIDRAMDSIIDASDNLDSAVDELS